MTLTIPGVATVHPRSEWVEPCFPISGRAQVPSAITQPVAHYSSALNLPDGDIGEFEYQIPPWLRASNRDYWLHRENSSPTVICGQELPGYSLGYLFGIDWLGGAWELRGFDFMPAANAGHNHYTCPLLFITDRTAPASDLAWKSARAVWREFRRRSGRADFKSRPLGHGELRETTGVGTPTVCPGPAIIAQLHAGLGDIDSEDDDMTPLDVPERVYDSRQQGGEFAANEVRTIPIGMCSQAFLHITAVGTAAGFISISGTDTPSSTSIVNLDPDGVASGGAPIGLPDGHVRVKASARCHVIVDVFARG